MTTSISPQSRIHVLDSPVAAPGVCSMCGSAGGDGRKFLDYGKQLDWYGAVYFCTECVGEFAQASGFITVDAFNNQAEEYANLQVKYDQLEKEYKAVKNALCTILEHTPDGTVGIIGDVVPNVSESEPSLDTNKRNDGGDSTSKQSTSVEGPDDVFDDSDFEQSDS